RGRTIMDGERFDNLTRTLATLRSRRGVLRALGLAVGVGTVGAIVREGDSNAASVCRAGGVLCTSDGNCCSNICKTPDFTGRRYCECTNTQTACGAKNCCNPG